MPCPLSNCIIAASSLYMLGDGSLHKLKPTECYPGDKFSSKMDVYLAVKSQIGPAVLQSLL